MAKRIKNADAAPESRPVALGELIHAYVRQAIEMAVHEKLAGADGAGRYERTGDRLGYRNGTKARTLTGPTGPVELTLPRGVQYTAAGGKEWTSTIVPRYERRLREVNEAVIATYLADLDVVFPYVDAIALHVRRAGKVVSSPGLGVGGRLGRRAELARHA